MTTTDIPTLEQVLHLARRLPPADQARLVAHLAPAIAAALTGTPQVTSMAEDPWEALLRLREEFRALGPVTPTITEELIASRR